MTRPPTFAEWAKMTPTESVARWRIGSAVWAARSLAIIWFFSSVVLALLNQTAKPASLLVATVVCILVYAAAEEVRRGGRTAAVFLLLVYLGDRVLAWYYGATWYQGGLLALILIFCFAQGVWDTFLLAHERAAHVRQ